MTTPFRLEHAVAIGIGSATLIAATVLAFLSYLDPLLVITFMSTGQFCN